MKPPYSITTEILRLVSSISEKIGEVNATLLVKSSPQLRKRNQIKTIHSSLQIEGNTLTEKQITAIIDQKRVLGPLKDILEVENAIKVYDTVADFRYDSMSSFLKAHKYLMEGLIEQPGKFRMEEVGIIKSGEVKHMAPAHTMVLPLMKNLFHYLKSDDDLLLIKSCVFHYETEFIHPFVDGNGRMGRLWQTVILGTQNPMFYYLAFETIIGKTQDEYYHALSASDKAGNSTLFIEYMLRTIETALTELLFNSVSNKMTQIDRLEHFYEIQKSPFKRKDYMLVFKQLSTASASRDLKEGIKMGLFEKTGDKRNTTYVRKE